MPEPTKHGDELVERLEHYLCTSKPRSFFLYAGAGSGKTHALVEAMNAFRRTHGREFRLSGQQVAVITYTNAACDEIKSRTDFDAVYAVSTIHSFAWGLIQPHYHDIREWLRDLLTAEIDDLQEKQSKGRPNSKAAFERPAKIEAMTRRRDRLNSVREFTYNPNGENIGKNSLNHAEVIALAAHFMLNKPLMRRILIRKYPVVLIDESQDTQKDLIDAFLKVQESHSEDFCLGLFGDMMQRIYSDGKVALDEAVPSTWAKPALVTNYRCPKRIVRLINNIRDAVDHHKQNPRDDASEGFVRVFLVHNTGDVDKGRIEARLADKMARVTGDEKWSGDDRDVKTLTLEHHMAARRGGFSGFFDPLYNVQRFRTGLLDGTLTGAAFLSQQVLPLVKTMQRGDKFAATRLIVAHSPLISSDTLKTSDNPLDGIRRAEQATENLMSLWGNGAVPALRDVVLSIAESGLFSIPDVFAPLIAQDEIEKEDGQSEAGAEDESPDEEVKAWATALSAPLDQLEAYVHYVSDESAYGTHQGIKGLQFPRVMVVLDDEDAKGFMFSYGKLLGAKPLTATDEKNVREQKETSVDRTRRLFYVICSRAQSSLAVVVYTNSTDAVMKHLKQLGWFDEEEVLPFGLDALEEDS